MSKVRSIHIAFLEEGPKANIFSKPYKDETVHFIEADPILEELKGVRDDLESKMTNAMKFKRHGSMSDIESAINRLNELIKELESE